MLHSMTIRLKHVDQLGTLYLCYGVKCQSGFMWGHWGQNVIFTKILWIGLLYGPKLLPMVLMGKL